MPPIGGRFRVPQAFGQAAGPLTVHGFSSISRPLSPTADRGSGLLGSMPKECRPPQKDALFVLVIGLYRDSPPFLIGVHALLAHD